MEEQNVYGVYEEALLEELAYLVAHIAHAEQHLLEVDSELEAPLLAPLVDELRDARKRAGRVLLEAASLRGGGGGEFRSNAENLWCVVKHLAMALVHCDECAEKIIHRAGGADALESLGELYFVRRVLRRSLKEILTGGKLPVTSGVESARCREDLCLEEAPPLQGGDGEEPGPSAEEGSTAYRRTSSS